MRIAGLQGVYGDPCGIDLIPVSLAEALCLNKEPIVLIDAGSVSPLFAVLNDFRQSSPRAQIIVIGTDADESYIECVISAGAKGFIPATATAEEFRTAIDTVREGYFWAPRKVLSSLIGRNARERAAPAPANPADVQLTPREAEVLQLLLGGHGNREIGENLGIDSGTVKGHLGRIMRKAGVANRVELSMYALHQRHEEPTIEPGPRRSS
jgi:DNA-binding NarL/FixJ family response regulator